MPHVDLDVARLPFDTPVRVENGDTGIVVVRTCAGVVAYEDVCPHAGWRLSQGEVVQGRLECPGHGWTFAVADGTCLDVPAYCLVRLGITPLGRSRVRIVWEQKRAPFCVARRA